MYLEAEQGMKNPKPQPNRTETGDFTNILHEEGAVSKTPGLKAPTFWHIIPTLLPGSTTKVKSQPADFGTPRTAGF